MPSKQATVRNGQTIQVQGLPANILIPVVPTNQIVTGVALTLNGNPVEAGTQIQVLPSDVLSVSYVGQNFPITTVTGTDILSAYLDGQEQIVTDDGILQIQFDSYTQNHQLIINGEQAQPYSLTFDNTQSTVIYANGVEVGNGTILKTTKDTHIQAKSIPIPVHFEVLGAAKVQINGQIQASQDFTVNVQAPTEVDIDASTCSLTVDYGDNSYTVQVPQGLVTLAAPHRNYWIFDCWSSQDVGIQNSKMVQTIIDLTGVTAATVVCHYQQFPAINKPFWWG